MELSKSDKKAARAIIEKGLQQEFAYGLNEFRDLLNLWKTNNADNRETYHTLYKRIKDFDKHIGYRYDEMRGSDYLFIMVAQFSEGFINDKDLVNLSAEAQNEIKRIISIRAEFNK